MDALKSLVLGTANFGSNYGHFDPHRINHAEAENILSWAIGRITEIDTSTDYPGSHEAIASQVQNFKVTTKIDLSNVSSENDLLATLSEIRKNLRIKNWNRILIRSAQFESKRIKALLNALHEFRNEGFFDSIGASIYETSDLVKIQESDLKLDTIQLPANIANREFDKKWRNGEIDLTRYSVYVRSIFLQGALLKTVEELPTRLREIGQVNALIRQESLELGVKPIDICLAYSKQIPWAQGLIVGVRNLRELQEIYTSFERPLNLRQNFIDLLPDVSDYSHDPRKW